MADNRTSKDRIRAFCERTGYDLGSHLMPRGFFIVSKPAPDRGRAFQVARYDTGRKSVAVVSEAFPLINGARGAMQCQLAREGVSNTSEPLERLDGLPQHPFGVLT